MGPGQVGLAAIGAVLASAWMIPPPSQTPTDLAEAQRRIVDTARVDVVNVDVHVTDNTGLPVTDLTAEDFEVYQDGVRVEITNFSVVDHDPAPSITPGPLADTPPTP